MVAASRASADAPNRNGRPGCERVLRDSAAELRELRRLAEDVFARQVTLGCNLNSSTDERFGRPRRASERSSDSCQSSGWPRSRAISTTLPSTD